MTEDETEEVREALRAAKISFAQAFNIVLGFGSTHEIFSDKNPFRQEWVDLFIEWKETWIKVLVALKEGERGYIDEQMGYRFKSEGIIK